MDEELLEIVEQLVRRICSLDFLRKSFKIVKPRLGGDAP
jgi:hypothetical protein